MIVVVTGSRDATERAHRPIIHAALYEIDRQCGGRVQVFHGAACGVDSIAAQWICVGMLPTVGVPADWINLGKRAGNERNRRMLDRAQQEATRRGCSIVVLAFPVEGSVNIGTTDCANEARRRGLRVETTLLLPEPHLSNGIRRMSRKSLVDGLK